MAAAPTPEPDAASDAQLMAAICDRDRAAFLELFRRYAGRVKAFAMRSGMSANDAEEIAQDVMVAVWRRAGTFDPDRAGVATWIYAIARNRRIDLIRKAMRLEPDPNDPLFQPEPEPDGLQHLTARERETQVRACLADLAPEQRAVLVASFYEGWSHGQIAAQLDMPLGTVKSRLRLAFGHMKGVLGADYGEMFDKDDG